jgi:hypothetical protein
MSIPAPESDHALVGGDDGGVIQVAYQISQTGLLTGFGLDTARIDLGKIVGTLKYKVVWYDTVSAAKVVLDFLTGVDVLVSTTTILDFTTQAAPMTQELSYGFVIPSTARKIKITLFARSPVGDGAANVGFDAFRYFFIDGDMPEKKDAVVGFGDIDTAFSTLAGSYTIDGDLVWKAHTPHVQFDEVATVTNRKLFTGTNIAGGVGAYETSLIRWISGANAGQKNIVRTWDTGTKAIKLYFPSLQDIEVGDRFQYVRACHKRFLEDCSLDFDNVLNFRGFPHLPGKVSG